MAHNAVAASNRRRDEALRTLPDVETTLLTPRWWREEGRRIAVPRSASWRVGRTAFTGNGTRHVYLTGLADTLRSMRPELIDLFEEPFSLVALETLLLRDLLAPGAAVVFYSAVNVFREWRWPYRAIERLVLARADGAHAPNADVPPILESKGFRGPTCVIPLGVDVDRFARPNARSLPGIERPRIGFVGRLEPVKGLDVLLEAFSYLRTTASLVIVGDGSLRADVQARLPARAHLLPAAPFEQMPSVLRSLDVLVLPSVTILPLHREQFGRVLVEAMASGVPVVGSDSGAIPEVIGDAGVVVPERDPLALATALDRVLSDADVRARLIEKGRQRAERHYAWPVVAEQTLDLFRSALLHRRRAVGRLANASQEVRA